MSLTHLPQLPPGYEIRRIKTTEEYGAAEELQGAAWGVIDRVDITPKHVLVTAQKNGGLVLGAFAPDGELVGFLFGFLGTSANGKLKHVSHQMGVHPKYRGLHLGYLLKRAQRGEVRRQGLDLITWTYDPLETVNANLNLTWLGAVNNTYLRNVYGEIRDSINRGLPSDRFQVDWWIRSQWVHERLSLAHPIRLADAVRTLPIVNPARSNHTEPGPLDGGIEATDVLIQVPYLFQSVKKLSLDLGYAWRMHTREAFETYFARGYSAIDMLRGDLGEGGVAFYRLWQPQDPAPWLVAEHTPDATLPSLPEALAEYATLFNSGFFWKAHEALEALWTQTEGDDKAFLQGLIRAAAAFHKLTAHANPEGADRHLTWVIETLTPFGNTRHGVNLAAFVAGLRTAQAAIVGIQDARQFDRNLLPKLASQLDP